MSAEQLVANADAAMYQAKRQQDGKPVLFNDMTPK